MIFMNTDEQKAKDFAKKIRDAFQAEVVKKFSARQEIFGPIPAAVSNLRGVHRFVLLIKSEDLSSVKIFLQAHGLHKRDDVLIDIDPLTTD